MSYRCEVCGLIYKYPQGLKRHKLSMHGASTPAIALYKCSVCGYACSQKKEFFHHLETSHDFMVSTEVMTFESHAEFYKWKQEYEKEDQNRFIVSFGNGRVESISKRPIYFVCHRSGSWRPEGKGLRNLKTQGSKKINGYCPAQIKITLSEDGELKVLLTRSHWGHLGDELAHISLTQDEKVSIAGKIATKVPFEDILNHIRDDAKKNEALKRVHLTTRKDLHNIEASFNLSSEAVRHKSDALSVDAWVTEVRDSQDDDCVLFYKPLGETSDEFPFLSENDFLLCIMNELQATMLEEYGKDTICIDGTHGLDPYDFQLITLIIYDMSQGFPCAFFFTNRTDKNSLIVFYKKIKERLSEFQPPKIFMSNMEDSFFNAWVEVFRPPPSQRLWCTWHVEEAWRKNLTRIESADKKREIQKTIKSLMEETEPEAFKIALSAASRKMSEDPETQNFGRYFDSHYASHPEKWAFSFRVHAGLNTNMHLENLKGYLKHNYLSGKRVKRLDKAIHALMQFLRDKAFDKVIDLHKGRVNKKFQELQKRHEASLVSTEKVVQNEAAWLVLSSSGQEMYKITLKKEQCDCQLFCAPCSACIHKYVCSCLDSSIEFNMCKHIHLLCSSQLTKMRHGSKMRRSSENVTGDDGSEIPIVIASSGHTNTREKQSLVIEICRGQAGRGNDGAELQEKLILTLSTLSEEVKQLGTPEMEALDKFLLPVQPTIQPIRERHNFKMPFEEVDTSNKRKMDLQHRLFPTRKKTRMVRNVRQKPQREEKNAIM